MSPPRKGRGAGPLPSAQKPPKTVGGHRLLRPLEGTPATWEVGSDDPERVALLSLGPRRDTKDRAEQSVFPKMLRARGSLRHPHLAAVVDGGTSSRGPYVVVSLPPARPLSILIAREPLSPERTYRLLVGVADALDAAHARWLIHLDLSPRAILVEPGPREWALLTDFGIVHERPALGFDRAAYRAPEELRGLPSDPRSNVYSLACVLYACLVGFPPFTRDSSEDVVEAQLTAAPPPPTDHRPDLPGAIDEVLARALAKEPEERYASPGELLRAAGQALGVLPPEPAITARPVGEGASGPARRHAPWPFGAAVERPRRARWRRVAALAGLGTPRHAPEETVTRAIGREAPGEAAPSESAPTIATATEPARAEVAARAIAPDAPVWPAARAHAPAKPPPKPGTKRTHRPAPAKPPAKPARSGPPPAPPARPARSRARGKVRGKPAASAEGEDPGPGTARSFPPARRRETTARSSTGLWAVALALALAIGGAGGWAIGGAGEQASGGESAAAPRESRLLAQRRERATWLEAANVAIERLNARRAGQRRRLDAARKPSGQAAVAELLAREFAGSAVAVDAPPPAAAPEGAGLATALYRAEGAYRGLATAARRERRDRYGDAAQEVRRAEREVRRAIAALEG